MSRPIPEAAPIVGVLLAFSFGLFGFLFGTNHLSTLLVSVGLLYGFTAFGIVRSPAPDEVFLPDPILAGGFLLAVCVAVYGLIGGQAAFGVLVAAVVFVPVALYHARYGESVNPISPGATLFVGLVAAAFLLASGVRRNLLVVGAISAVIVGLGAVDYHRKRGGELDRTTRTAAVTATLGGSLVVVVVSVLSGRTAEGLAAGALGVALGAFLAVGVDRTGP